VKPPTFGLPMSSQSIVLEIVPAWVAWPSRVPTIASLMTPFLATKTNQRYYAIPFLVCDDACQLGCLVPQELEWIWMVESSLCFPLPSLYKHI
jgi:hypothetical protein